MPLPEGPASTWTPWDCGGFPLQSLLQLVTYRSQGLALVTHVFHRIEQQGAQRGGHAGLGKGIHEGLDFRCQVQAALPTRGFLAEVEFAAQAGQFVTDQIHDFPAVQHVAFLHFAGAFAQLHIKALRCGQYAGALGCRLFGRRRLRAADRGHDFRKIAALCRLGGFMDTCRNGSNHRIGGLIRGLVNVDGHHQFGLTADRVIGDNQHIAAI